MRSAMCARCSAEPILTTVQPSTRLLGLRLTYEPEPFTARAAIEISAHS